MPQGFLYAFEREDPLLLKEILGVKALYYPVKELFKVTGKLTFATDLDPDFLTEELEEFRLELLQESSLEKALEKLEEGEEDLIVVCAGHVLIRAETLLELYNQYLSSGRKPSQLFYEDMPLKVFVLPFEEKGNFSRINFSRVQIENEEESLFLESLFDLSFATEVLRLEKIEELMENGVEILDPSTTWISQKTTVGQGTVIYPFNFIAGKSSVGRGVTIHSFCHIYETQIGDEVVIYPSSFLKGAKVHSKAQIGPFARLREGAEIMEGARIGNFVEVKKSVVGKGSKALHLTYIGDATVGENVNIGAGTITCNYDGEKKYPTYIEDRAFIGSGVELVAPVRVGHDAYVAAGSTITDDVPPFALAIARQRQVNKIDWVKKKKGRS